MAPNAEKVYVQLLNEGMKVYRPVSARRVADGLLEILPQVYDADDEQWQFTPGSLVRVESRQLSEGDVLVAVESVH